MSKYKKEHSSISIEEIRKIRGHKLTVLMRSVKKIPYSSGVYVWRYWPSTSSLDKKSVIGTLHDLQKTFPRNIERISNSRVSVTVEKTPFGREYNERGMFGYSKNSNKEKVIYKMLDQDEEARLVFANTLEMLVASSPPVYIGKANNLQLRLDQHFNRKTNVLQEIEDAGISLSDIYISFIIDETNALEKNKELSPCIEEILQRITNPPLTKRYG